MACGCNSKTPKATFTWTSNDGKQTATNLNSVQAQTRLARKGGKVEPEPAAR